MENKKDTEAQPTINKLFDAIDRLKAVSGLSEKQVSNRIFRSSDRLSDIRNGSADVTTRKLDGFMKAIESEIEKYGADKTTT